MAIVLVVSRAAKSYPAKREDGQPVAIASGAVRRSIWNDALGQNVITSTYVDLFAYGPDMGLLMPLTVGQTIQVEGEVRQVRDEWVDEATGAIRSRDKLRCVVEDVAILADGPAGADGVRVHAGDSLNGVAAH